MISTIISGVAKLGSSWMESKGKISEAKLKLTLARLAARTDLAQLDAKAENNLDELAVRQSAETLWDEFLCIVAMIPLALICYNAFNIADPADSGEAMLNALESLPTWYQILIGAIYVRYLGFRRLISKFIEAKAGKIAAPSLPPIKE